MIRVTLRPLGRAALWCFALVLTAVAGTGPAKAQQPWPFVGGDLHNSGATLSPVSPNQLRPNNTARLHEVWELTTSGDVSATPTVEPGGVYFPDWGGTLYKVDPASGSVIWQHKLSEYTGDPNSISRSSPAIAGNMLIFGDISIARVIAVDKNTGQRIWAVRVDNSNNAMVSSSSTVYNGVAYFGVSSREEIGAVTRTPTFRGSVVALDVKSGRVLWRFTTVPAGYSGGAVVPTPVVDDVHGSLYVATDNNYSIPADAASCVGTAGSATQDQLACLDPTDYVDSVLALDLNSGGLKWSRRFQGADTWTDQCNSSSGCAQPPGLDFDFASAPNFFKVAGFAGTSDDRGGTSDGWVIGIGQKSGMYRALNPLNGGLHWSTLVGLGGIQWGSAFDLDEQTHIFVAVKNDAHQTNTLTDYYGNKTQWNAGSWGSIDARTGQLIWQIPAYGRDLRNTNVGASAPGAVTFTNYLVFAGSSSGYFTCLDSTTGRIWWKFFAGGTVSSAPAVFDDVIYWGTGYARIGVGNHKFYAFSVK